jgi:hypothetical protein
MQRLHRHALRLVFRDASEQQFLVAVLQVVRQFIEDFGLAGSFQRQPGETLANDFFPIRHNRSP